MGSNEVYLFAGSATEPAVLIDQFVLSARLISLHHAKQIGQVSLQVL